MRRIFTKLERQFKRRVEPLYHDWYHLKCPQGIATVEVGGVDKCNSCYDFDGGVICQYLWKIPRFFGFNVYGYKADS